MAKTVTHVMLPSGSRSEVDVARAALKRHGDERSFSMGAGPGHTAGQTLYGDLVVVGRSLPASREGDATGKVWHVDSVGELAGLEFDDGGGRAEPREVPRMAGRPPWNEVQPAPTPVPEPVPVMEPGYAPEVGAPQPEPEPEPEPDDLDNLNRVDLIQHAAAEWPGQERWANMANDAIKRYIRNRRNEA